MAIWAKLAAMGIGEMCTGIGSLAKDLRLAITGELTPEDKAAVELKILELETVAQQLNSKTQEFQTNVIIAEAKGDSWLQRNWRPGLMALFGIIVANNFIIAPYVELIFGAEKMVMLPIPEHLWGLLKLGVGGYIVGRSGEKIVNNWKAKE